MTIIATRLNYFMELHGINGADLARQTNIQPSTINKILNSKIVDPRISTIQTLADFFEVTTENFLKETSKIQEQESTSYSFSSLLEKCEEIATQPINRFKVEYYGEDMSPFFGNGAILEFDKNIQPKNKDFVLALIKTALEKPIIVFRRYLDGATEKYLEPMNAQFKSIPIRSDDQILGVLVESYNKFL